MSDHIPFEIQVEIIKKLPIKSLIQFRSVSKAWKSVTESSDFIADYTLYNPTQPQHLLIRYVNPSSEQTYVSIVDDDTFPLNKFSPTVPQSVNLLKDSFVVDTSHGLVCLFGFYSETPVTVVWNPSIRKSVVIDMPDVVVDWLTLGFGVCPATSDPKIVMIKDTRKDKKIPWEVEVFTLSSGVWRSSFGNLSDKLIDIDCPQVTLDGFIYWFGVVTGFLLVVSFDLLSEVFREIYLPNELAYLDRKELYLFNRCDSLAVLKENIMNNKYEVWKMENGVSKSFMKLFTVSMPNELVRRDGMPLEFRRNGEITMATLSDDNDDSEELDVYDPLSGHIDGLGIKGVCNSLFANSYTESLILLDH